MPGSGVCWYHGGNKKAVRLAAQRRLAEQEARELMATYGKPVVGLNPVDALLHEIEWTAGHIEWLRVQVQTLENDELTWGESQTMSAGDQVQIVRRAAPHILVQVYQQERRHLLECTAVAIKAGVEERRVRLAERYGATIADVFRRLLDAPELGLDTEKWVLGRQLAAGYLRALPGGLEAT